MTETVSLLLILGVGCSLNGEELVGGSPFSSFWHRSHPTSEGDEV